MKKFAVALLALSLVAPLFARDVDAVVTADWLEKNISNPKLVVVDVRKVEDYKAGHIPGAVNSFASSWSVKKGNLNAELPEADDLTDLILDAGIDASSIVVIVESEGGARYHVAARVAITLVYAGLDNIAILDGGMAAWTGAGKAVSTDMVKGKKVSFTLKPRPAMFISQDQVVKTMATSQYLDARSYDSYFGRSKFANSTQFGHIPGSYATPKEWLYDEKGMLVSKDKIQELLSALKLDPAKETVGYCDTGMGCAIWYWVLAEQLGWKNVKVYDGSSEELTRNPAVKYVKYTWR